MAKSARPVSWVTQLALGAVALATLVFTAQHVRPVYAGRAPVVAELLESPYLANLTAIAPGSAIPGQPDSEITPMSEPVSKGESKLLMAEGSVSLSNTSKCKGSMDSNIFRLLKNRLADRTSSARK